MVNKAKLTIFSYVLCRQLPDLDDLYRPEIVRELEDWRGYSDKMPKNIEPHRAR